MEVKPLTSLDALMSWEGPGILKEILERIPPLAPRSHPVPTLPPSGTPSYQFKTIVCHDMKNGYLDDRLCFGSGNVDAYRFYHWNSLDTFIYFSHHFITIPPCGWTQTAHRHGVKVLGTIITEWDEGESIWNILLDDSAVMELAINNLVEIAHAYKFEGWLLNVENKIEPEKVNGLVYFARELTRRMHHRNLRAEVIWYDSVTCDGKLDWQNELNDKNKVFFDACDGIFLNYSWKEINLETSVSNAKQRITDVFVGVDVYGRNFYQGGGFNVFKAMDLIRKHNLSAAIFAQGWTHEVLGSVDFMPNENKLWESLERSLLYHGPTQLPLKTSFCQGFGKNIYHRGKIVEEGDWYNLSKQQIQPNWEEVSRMSERLCSMSCSQAFSGGSCMTLWVDNDLSVRLMVFKIALVPNMEFSFAYKLVGSVNYLSFIFPFQEQKKEQTTDGGQVSEDSSKQLCFIGESTERCRTPPANTFSQEEEEKENGWVIRRYNVMQRDNFITSFIIKAEGTGLIIFGELSIEQRLKKE